MLLVVLLTTWVLSHGEVLQCWVSRIKAAMRLTGRVVIATRCVTLAWVRVLTLSVGSHSSLEVYDSFTVALLEEFKHGSVEEEVFQVKYVLVIVAVWLYLAKP